MEMEQEPGILAATVFATQPWMDVTELGWSTVVVADGDRALAQAKADELGMMAWERRERFLVHKTPITEAMQQALAGEGQPFVMADSSDSVTGGGYGDGNLLLQALLEMGYQDTALLTLTDPEAVAACLAAGVGAKVTMPVGGKLTPAVLPAGAGHRPREDALRRPVRVRAARPAGRHGPHGRAAGRRHQHRAERAPGHDHRPGDLPQRGAGAPAASRSCR